MQNFVELSVVSWNCLADCYARGTIVGKRRNSEKVITWPLRSRKISEVLYHCDADIVCLQEVDHFSDHYEPLLTSLKHHVVYVQRPDREDGVLIAFKHEKFDLVEKRIVQFDDLAHASTPHMPVSQKEKLRKHNVALILLMKTKSGVWQDHGVRDCFFTISTTHMYWNPRTPQIKLAQTVYLMERITEVRQENGLPPTASILTGDFNSLPRSQAYERVLSGTSYSVLPKESNAEAVQRACAVVYSSLRHGSRVRFICDATLGRMVRWLRLLGVDTALEDKHSQDRRSQYNDYSELFEKARKEQRIIVTTSKGLLRRVACPETFLVNPSKSESLEKCLATLLNFYGVELNQADILSMCGKCGFRIESCTVEDPRLKGKEAPTDKDLFICVKCHQVYWWSDSMNGCSARARRLAHSLFSLVEAERLRGSSSFGSTQERELQSSEQNGELSEVDISLAEEGTEDLPNQQSFREEGNHLEACNRNWLRFKSVFSHLHGEEPRCTNINGSFRGTLDYIFVGGSYDVVSAVVQDHFQARRKGHARSFPNRDWPSDHMLIRADLILRRQFLGRLPFERTKSLPS